MDDPNSKELQKNSMSGFTRFLISKPVFAKYFFKFQAFVFRNTNGSLMSTLIGYPICVVNMLGAKTKKLRSVPIMHVPYKEGIIIVASKGGADEHPKWYWNLKTNPEVEIFIKGKKFKSNAIQFSNEEKENLWPLICEVFPNYKRYQESTNRNIPVFNCQPL